MPEWKGGSFVRLFRRRRPKQELPPRHISVSYARDPDRHRLDLAGNIADTYWFLRPTGYEMVDWRTPPLVLTFRGPDGDEFTARMGDTLVRSGPEFGSRVWAERV
ncbi:hypothetical protein ACIQMR_35400 [Streptomyces sp. NPDC091376]|uniref:hypothetical protein n=1 Tax=Streptomyces sp. NPDC091376 TaxID=3365994 RepID=UPI003803762B